MEKKDKTSKKDLLFIVELLEKMQIKYYLVGGWGIDVLKGKQCREHRDIDINFDENFTEELISILIKAGYKIETDLRPLRIELYSKQHGYIDIHPFVINDNGSAKKSDTNGNWWIFDKDYFTLSEFSEKRIPCLSIKGQKVFHSGYELLEKDKFDLSVLNNLV